MNREITDEQILRFMQASKMAMEALVKSMETIDKLLLMQEDRIAKLEGFPEKGEEGYVSIN